MTDQVAADRKVAREVIGADISDEEFDKAPDVLGNLYRIAAEKARTAGHVPVSLLSILEGAQE
jgi:hypothetical protein